MLSFTRLFWLIRNDIRLHAKNILIVALTLIVLLALIPFHVTGNVTFYYFILYVGGFIISSSVFADYHSHRKAFFYLTLPCSNLERFFSRWFETSILYALALLLLYYLFSLVSNLINWQVYHQQLPLFNIIEPSLWREIVKYIILQSIILLGAVTFKKYALIKTALVIGCYFLIFSLFSLLITLIVCPHCLQQDFAVHLRLPINHLLFWIIAAPVCWIVTYLRLNEIELR